MVFGGGKEEHLKEEKSRMRSKNSNNKESVRQRPQRKRKKRLKGQTTPSNLSNMDGKEGARKREEERASISPSNILDKRFRQRLALGPVENAQETISSVEKGEKNRKHERTLSPTLSRLEEVTPKRFHSLLHKGRPINALKVYHYCKNKKLPMANFWKPNTNRRRPKLVNNFVPLSRASNSGQDYGCPVVSETQCTLMKMYPDSSLQSDINGEKEEVGDCVNDHAEAIQGSYCDSLNFDEPNTFSVESVMEFEHEEGCEFLQYLHQDNREAQDSSQRNPYTVHCNSNQWNIDQNKECSVDVQQNSTNSNHCHNDLLDHDQGIGHTVLNSPNFMLPDHCNIDPQDVAPSDYIGIDQNCITADQLNSVTQETDQNGTLIHIAKVETLTEDDFASRKDAPISVEEDTQVSSTSEEPNLLNDNGDIPREDRISQPYDSDLIFQDETLEIIKPSSNDKRIVSSEKDIAGCVIPEKEKVNVVVLYDDDLQGAIYRMETQSSEAATTTHFSESDKHRVEDSIDVSSTVACNVIVSNNHKLKVCNSNDVETEAEENMDCFEEPPALLTKPEDLTTITNSMSPAHFDKSSDVVSHNEEVQQQGHPEEAWWRSGKNMDSSTGFEHEMNDDGDIYPAVTFDEYNHDGCLEYTEEMDTFNHCTSPDTENYDFDFLDHTNYATRVSGLEDIEDAESVPFHYSSVCEELCAEGRNTPMAESLLSDTSTINICSTENDKILPVIDDSEQCEDTHFTQPHIAESYSEGLSATLDHDLTNSINAPEFFHENNVSDKDRLVNEPRSELFDTGKPMVSEIEREITANYSPNSGVASGQGSEDITQSLPNTLSYGSRRNSFEVEPFVSERKAVKSRKCKENVEYRDSDEYSKDDGSDDFVNYFSRSRGHFVNSSPPLRQKNAQFRKKCGEKHSKLKCLKKIFKDKRPKQYAHIIPKQQEVSPILNASALIDANDAAHNEDTLFDACDPTSDTTKNVQADVISNLSPPMRRDSPPHDSPQQMESDSLPHVSCDVPPHDSLQHMESDLLPHTSCDVPPHASSDRLEAVATNSSSNITTGLQSFMGDNPPSVMMNIFPPVEGEESAEGHENDNTLGIMPTSSDEKSSTSDSDTPLGDPNELLPNKKKWKYTSTNREKYLPKIYKKYNIKRAPSAKKHKKNKKDSKDRNARREHCKRKHKDGKVGHTTTAKKDSKHQSSSKDIRNTQCDSHRSEKESKGAQNSDKTSSERHKGHKHKSRRKSHHGIHSSKLHKENSNKHDQNSRETDISSKHQDSSERISKSDQSRNKISLKLVKNDGSKSSKESWVSVEEHTGEEASSSMNRKSNEKQNQKLKANKIAKRRESEHGKKDACCSKEDEDVGVSQELDLSNIKDGNNTNIHRSEGNQARSKSLTNEDFEQERLDSRIRDLFQDESEQMFGKEDRKKLKLTIKTSKNKSNVSSKKGKPDKATVEKEKLARSQTSNRMEENNKDVSSISDKNHKAKRKKVVDGDEKMGKYGIVIKSTKENGNFPFADGNSLDTGTRNEMNKETLGDRDEKSNWNAKNSSTTLEKDKKGISKKNDKTKHWKCMVSDKISKYKEHGISVVSNSSNDNSDSCKTMAEKIRKKSMDSEAACTREVNSGICTEKYLDTISGEGTAKSNSQSSSTEWVKEKDTACAIIGRNGKEFSTADKKGGLVDTELKMERNDKENTGNVSKTAEKTSGETSFNLLNANKINKEKNDVISTSCGKEKEKRSKAANVKKSPLHGPSDTDKDKSTKNVKNKVGKHFGANDKCSRTIENSSDKQKNEVCVDQIGKKEVLCQVFDTDVKKMKDVFKKTTKKEEVRKMSGESLSPHPSNDKPAAKKDESCGRKLGRQQKDDIHIDKKQQCSRESSDEGKRLSQEINNFNWLETKLSSKDLKEAVIEPDLQSASTDTPNRRFPSLENPSTKTDNLKRSNGELSRAGAFGHSLMDQQPKLNVPQSAKEKSLQRSVSEPSRGISFYHPTGLTSYAENTQGYGPGLSRTLNSSSSASPEVQAEVKKAAADSSHNGSSKAWGKKSSYTREQVKCPPAAGFYLPIDNDPETQCQDITSSKASRESPPVESNTQTDLSEGSEIEETRRTSGQLVDGKESPNVRNSLKTSTISNIHSASLPKLSPKKMWRIQSSSQDSEIDIRKDYELDPHVPKLTHLSQSKQNLLSMEQQSNEDVQYGYPTETIKGIRTPVVVPQKPFVESLHDAYCDKESTCATKCETRLLNKKPSIPKRSLESSLERIFAKNSEFGQKVIASTKDDIHEPPVISIPEAHDSKEGSTSELQAVKRGAKCLETESIIYQFQPRGPLILNDTEVPLKRIKLPPAPVRHADVCSPQESLIPDEGKTEHMEEDLCRDDDVVILQQKKGLPLAPKIGNTEKPSKHSPSENNAPNLQLKDNARLREGYGSSVNSNRQLPSLSRDITVLTLPSVNAPLDNGTKSNGSSGTVHNELPRVEVNFRTSQQIFEENLRPTVISQGIRNPMGNLNNSLSLTHNSQPNIKLPTSEQNTCLDVCDRSQNPSFSMCLHEKNYLELRSYSGRLVQQIRHNERAQFRKKDVENQKHIIQLNEQNKVWEDRCKLLEEQIKKDREEKLALQKQLAFLKQEINSNSRLENIIHPPHSQPSAVNPSYGTITPSRPEQSKQVGPMSGSNTYSLDSCTITSSPYQPTQVSSAANRNIVSNYQRIIPIGTSLTKTKSGVSTATQQYVPMPNVVHPLKPVPIQPKPVQQQQQHNMRELASNFLPLVNMNSSNQWPNQSNINANLTNQQLQNYRNAMWTHSLEAMQQSPRARYPPPLRRGYQANRRNYQYQ